MKHLIALFTDLLDSVRRNFPVIRAFAIGAIVVHLHYTDWRVSLIWVAVLVALLHTYLQQQYSRHAAMFMVGSILIGFAYWMWSMVVFSAASLVGAPSMSPWYFLFLIINLMVGMPVILLAAAFHVLIPPVSMKQAELSIQ